MNYDATWPGGTRVRFRTLTWKEFQHFSTLPLSKPARNLAVYKAYLLSGPLPDQVPAGVVAWIGCEQIDQSPFGSKFKILNQYLQLGRNWLGSSYIHQAQALVAGTLHYTPEQVESMDAEKFFKRLAARRVAGGQAAGPGRSRQDRERTQGRRLRAHHSGAPGEPAAAARREDRKRDDGCSPAD